MINVGINEDVVLQKVELTEKEGKYSLDFSFGEGDVTISDNPFEQELDDNGYVKTSAGNSTLKVFTPFAPKDTDFSNNPVSAKDKYASALKTVGELRNLLTQFALCYTTSDKFKFDPYLGSGLTQDNVQVMLPTQEVIDRIFVNISKQFIEVMTPLLTEEPVKLRLLLCRQSADKHFPTFRRNFIREQPVVELMAVPKESSKLKFSAYEIGKGLNDGTPKAQSEADSTAHLTEEQVFSGN
jgi:hypothetical protein